MPRTKRAVPPYPLKRLPTNPYLVGAWIGLLVVGLVLLAIEATTHAIMGGPLYLYHQEDGDGGDDSDSPVIELLKGEHPDFLEAPPSDPNFLPPPRVVEFYAPWCPHCQHYAPKYKQLAAKVMRSHPSVKFYAVSCVANKDLCKSQNVNSYPTIKRFREGSYEEAGRGSVSQGVAVWLEELGLDEGADGKGGGGTGSASSTTKKLRKAPGAASAKREKARVVPFREHDVHDAWADASASFEFALKNGIYMENGPLPPDKSRAFRAWLELLSESLPHQMGRTRNLVEGLLENFAMAAGGQSSLNDLVRRRAGPEPRWAWRTCTYGDNQMGYTCGLWQLFHVMSVGVVEHNRHVEDDGPAIATLHASETLRNYIDHFFQCDVCRMNFLSMYDTCAFDGCHRLSENPSSSEREWRELPLWLWETHNDVNARLLGERLEMNEQPEPNQWESQQARWPTLYSCPNCWRDDRSWEEEKVYEHLRAVYWSGNPSHLKIPSSGDGNGIGGGGPSSRATPLRWKLSVVVFGVAAFVLRLYGAKKVRRNSGRHKK